MLSKITFYQIEDILAHYNELNDQSSAEANFKSTKTYSKETSLASCASKCDHETSLQCQSFRFCEKESACNLGEEHLNATTPPWADNSFTNSAASYCNFYTSKYPDKKFILKYPGNNNQVIFMCGLFINE